MSALPSLVVDAQTLDGVRAPGISIEQMMQRMFEDQKYLIVLAWDGERTHIVTWGKTLEDCSLAADGGNRLKEKWGWPESNDQPSRVRNLQQENKALQQALPLLQAEIARLIQVIIDLEQHNLALIQACQTLKTFLNKLEDGTEPDDPLTALRKQFHAPLHSALDAALNFRATRSANAEEPQPVSTVEESASQKASEGAD